MVRRVTPFFGDFILEPSERNPNRILLAWQEHGSPHTFFAHQLSDGTLRFICLAALLLQPPSRNRPEMILIDEPELGLHPFAISMLVPMLEGATRWAQVIVSTQSVALLDEVDDPEKVLVVEREGASSTFRRLEAEKLADWREEYSLGELWLKNVLGGRPHPPLSAKVDQ